MSFAPGQRVEVWFDGWDQWVSGTVERVGYIGGVPCALVQLDGFEQQCVRRLDQMRAEEGLFGLMDGVCGFEGDVYGD